ncbi:TPA: hypothetical protein DIC40_07575 [Patescibacteria group bacterium]|nr:hypothetical protein P148_SR1C00001G0805 [candidate division SR1 bacterium RAAC1_SR1_1]HCY21650.1 hypothetical protein [Candidatus Gracilibacteria bacterium]
MKTIFQNSKPNIILFIIAIFIFILANSSLFIIKEGEQASAFLFGKPKRDYTESGLKTKYPWERVIKVDKRLLLYNAREMTLQEKTKKKLLVDYFCLFKIDNPKTFFTKVVDMNKANHRIDDHISSDIAAILGENIFEDIVTNNRQGLLDTIKSSSNHGLDDIDISIKFLSFNRVELPDENKKAVFSDMIADRQKITDGYLAEGQKLKDSIVSHANFRADDIVATARKNAEAIKGSADSTRLAMLNKAYAKSKDLFHMYNEVETFKKVYANNTEWILPQDKLLIIPK